MRDAKIDTTLAQWPAVRIVARRAMLPAVQLSVGVSQTFSMPMRRRVL
jgi:hypothetical protein